MYDRIKKILKELNLMKMIDFSHQIQDEREVNIRSASGERTVSVDDIFSGIEPVLQDIIDYATLSAAVYAKDDAVLIKIRPELAPTFDRWKPVDLTQFEGEVHLPKWRHQIGKADFKVWALDESVPKRVVLAFRGTDFKEAADWFSNFRWITRIIPFKWDQYDQVRSWLEGGAPLLSAIRSECPDSEIIVVGHSLGGGLAQQAVYATSEICRAVTFNASAVTGYYSVSPKNTRLSNADGSEIFRVYEHGEGLAYLRWFMKKIYNPFSGNMRIVEVRYDVIGNSDGSNAIEQHSIIAFTRRLVELNGE